MSSPTVDPAAPAAREEHSLRRGRLGAMAIAFFVISAAAPLTGMGGGAPFAMLLGNGPGVPAAYLVVTLLMLVFSVGYVAMARHHTSTGAFYSYLSRGMGGLAGGASAFVALLGYNAMQIGLYGLLGILASAFMEGIVGVSVSWAICALVAWAIVAFLGYRQVDLSLKVLAVLVAGEFLIVILFDIMALVKGGTGATGTPLSFSSFTWSSFTSGAPAIGLLFAAASFVGFEATTLYSEEAKEPHRTVPRATYIAVLTIGIFFMITSWLMVNAYGDDETLVPFIGGDKDVEGLATPTDFLFAMAGPYIGDFLTSKVMLFLFVTSLFAAVLAFHNAVARYTFALGREGLVPARLGNTHRVHLSPHMGSASQSVLALVILLLWIVTGSDPNNLFTWLTQLGTLAITFLMAFASLAVVLYFRSHPGLESNPWKTTIAPLLGFVGLLIIGIYATAQFGFLINLPGSALSWILPLLIPIFGVIGVIAANRLKSKAPDRFASLGRHRPSEVGLP